jgi:aspartate dehydrogenase
MAKVLKIGIVGCGAIGTSLSKVIVKDFSKKAKLIALYDKVAGKSEKLAKTVSKNRLLAVGSLDGLIRKSDLVIEAALADSSWDIAKRVLSCGRDIMIMSVGGIVSHMDELSKLSHYYNAKVYIPSGAISGIDALKAASVGKIKSVILTTRKNPLSFEGVKFVRARKLNLGKIKKDTILFSGTAAQAMRFFPQNINVAGILSIAGIGRFNTRVKIIASPTEKRNIHEIQIESSAGKIFTRTENILHPDNPKTSYLAVLSAVATLKQILQPVRIGT